MEVAGCEPENLEEKAISLVGRPLYEAFIRGYTAKQWQTDPRDLPANIITRLPVRYTFDDRYFNDRFQGQPLDGVHGDLREDACQPIDRDKAGRRLLRDQERASAWAADRLHRAARPLFRLLEGALGWRTLDFENEVAATGDFRVQRSSTTPTRTCPTRASWNSAISIRSGTIRPKRP